MNKGVNMFLEGMEEMRYWRKPDWITNYEELEPISEGQ